MRCPTCNLEFKIESSTVKPFCSARCQTIDLGRWLDETNRLPHVPNIEADETPDDNWSGEPLSDAKDFSTEEPTDA